MSSTNRGGQRSKADFYETPAWVVEWLLRVWRPLLRESTAHMDRPLRVLEPCAGCGAIIGACNAVGVQADWWANELDPERHRSLLDSGLVPPVRVLNCDFLSELGWPRLPPIDCILTNPPYSQAEEFLHRALQLAPTVCFLLRLNFLGSQRRADFLRRHPPDVYVLSKRPSFTGKGTDSVEYAWMVWHRDSEREAGALMVLNGRQGWTASPMFTTGARRGT